MLLEGLWRVDTPLEENTAGLILLLSHLYIINCLKVFA